MKEVSVFNPTVDFIREKILKAGNKIGSVYFYRRSDNKLRKICYRLHSYKSLKRNTECLTSSNRASHNNRSNRSNRRQVDMANNLITVLSTNDIKRDKLGNILGRGQYKSIPLDRIIRICVNGEITNFHRV